MGIPQSRNWPWFVLGIGILLISFFALSEKDIRSYQMRKEEVKHFKQEISNLDQDVLHKRELLHRLKSNDEALEILARKELGLMRPGEIEFRFVPSEENRDID